MAVIEDHVLALHVDFHPLMSQMGGVAITPEAMRHNRITAQEPITCVAVFRHGMKCPVRVLLLECLSKTLCCRRLDLLQRHYIGIGIGDDLDERVEMPFVRRLQVEVHHPQSGRTGGRSVASGEEKTPI